MFTGQILATARALVGMELIMAMDLCCLVVVITCPSLDMAMLHLGLNALIQQLIVQALWQPVMLAQYKE